MKEWLKADPLPKWNAGGDPQPLDEEEESLLSKDNTLSSEAFRGTLVETTVGV